MDKYEPIYILGEGHYSKVYKARNKITNEFVVVKKMKENYKDKESCL